MIVRITVNASATSLKELSCLVHGLACANKPNVDFFLVA